MSGPSIAAMASTPSTAGHASIGAGLPIHIAALAQETIMAKREKYPSLITKRVLMTVRSDTPDALDQLARVAQATSLEGEIEDKRRWADQLLSNAGFHYPADFGRVKDGSVEHRAMRVLGHILAIRNAVAEGQAGDAALAGMHLMNDYYLALINENFAKPVRVGLGQIGLGGAREGRDRYDKAALYAEFKALEREHKYKRKRYEILASKHRFHSADAVGRLLRRYEETIPKRARYR